MAFLGKVGGILRQVQTVGRRVDSHFSPSGPSIFHALRWMSSSKVYIGGLSYGTDETTLRDTFAQYGEVVDARIIVDRESGRSKGFGFVAYASSEQASCAIQALDGQEIQGRRVKVSYMQGRDNALLELVAAAIAEVAMAVLGTTAVVEAMEVGTMMVAMVTTWVSLLVGVLVVAVGLKRVQDRDSMVADIN